MAENDADTRRGFWPRLVRAATAVELGLAAAAAATIFVLVLLQAFQRYLPVDGWSWTGELARFSLVWLTFVAAGVLVTRDGHIALQVVDTIRRPLLVRTVHVIANVVLMVIALLFARECLALISGSGVIKSPAMRMPMSWHYILPFIGFVSTAIRAGAVAWIVIRRGVAESHDTDSLALNVNREVQS
ncbi:TRAP transporter small permease [Zhihengliuella halotolerans]|uniref:TRAP-type C4-dicarboxylate transport system permease small subunit n=1 Tax=Zhihengliuella halotolerans TaxID=370736 RepID=A0A4Q8AEG4_9MICC|nr:TRAP transporter small permease subunit [Zhihengliuella halotolerans]RZU62618.1 TRAP-type C4-dicarboxylate transport system permease small subunit [Zhihengliuella halotolerans]